MMNMASVSEEITRATVTHPGPARGVVILCLLAGLLPSACSRSDPPPSSQTPTTLSQTAGQEEGSVRPPQPNQERADRRALLPAQAWALATSAILFERNRDRHDTLGGREPTPTNREDVQRLLSEWWGVTDRETLLKTLEWIEKGGHRREFNGMGASIESLSSEQFQELLTNAQGHQEVSHRVQFVKQYYPKLWPKSLLGWDYGRYVALARWGYFVGYLTEEEAWGRIMPAAHQLQRAFDSWKELGENYLIGREFWSLEETRRNGQLYRDIYAKLMDDPGSPWNRYPWQLDLDAAGTQARL